MTDTPATLVLVTSSPPGAAVSIDGNDRNVTTPARFTDLSPGPHIISVAIQGCAPKSRVVTVEAGVTRTIVLTLMNEENRRMINLIGYYTLALICAVVLFVLALRLGIIFTDASRLTVTVAYLASAGALGGLTFSMYRYTYHLGQDDFDLDYLWWYLFRPFLGVIYGTFVFLLLVGGLMTISTAAPETDAMFTMKNVMFYCALSFLAGYAEEPVSLQLKAIAEAIFKKPGVEEDKKKEKNKE